ncbi:hypothetical protein JSY36_11895 [Bacillus sp. H-16]|uniref:hypothetical protein n=1 Tax=Alteribacter salitolerans TaxID=2912333 RepID=UPI001963799C|nr:hypothetical protein [Alteribacter salitolerans]MBM7096448.1 hypothetical protein [Alteribacter salitolerans]
MPVIVILLSLLAVIPAHSDMPWLNNASLKVTVETEDTLYEWEYENPRDFEFERGSTIVRGDAARESFEEILTFLDLSRPTLSNEEVQKMAHKYGNVKKVVIKRVDKDRCFQTWKWESEK